MAIFRKHRTPYVLLHTTNLYPTPPHLVRLGAMVQLKEVLVEVEVVCMTELRIRATDTNLRPGRSQ